MSGAFEIEGGILRKYRGDEARVSIPEGVTEIGSGAFKGCSALASVDIPGSVTKIGDEAFYDCRLLVSVDIPEGVTRIGNFAFMNCDALASVVVPKSVKEIGMCALGLPSATVVCHEGSFAHRYCEENYIRTPFLFDYQYEAFGGLLPQGFEKLASPFMADEEGPFVFVSYSHRDRDKVLPVIKELYEEGWRIWYDEGLTIGDSYDKTLEEHVRSCSAFLLFVTPNSLQSSYIGKNEVPWAVGFGKPIVECVLEGQERYPIQGGSAAAVVTSSAIGPALNQVEGLVKGGPREAKGITVVVDPAARNAAAGGGYACCLYSKDGATTAKAIMLEARRAGCILHDAVEEGLDPEKLRHCACLVAFLDRAFLRDVSLTWTLARKYQAGRDVAVCALEEVGDADLPERLSGLDKEHWLVYSHGITGDLNAQLARHLQRLGCRDASALPSFEYEKTDWGLVITKYTGLDPSPRIEFSYGGVPVVAIADGAFEECVHLREVAIPEEVVRIGDNAFAECKALTSISIPEGVEEIGKWAFAGCAALTSISIPESVMGIGRAAFVGCHALASISIPEGVAEIEELVFSGCKALASVSISEGVMEIGDRAFSGCKALASIDIPRSVTEIGAGAFQYCTSLTSVSISEGVTMVGYRAFRGCAALASVDIPGSVMEIQESAFEDCEGLTVFCPRGSYAWGYCEDHGIPVKPKPSQL